MARQIVLDAQLKNSKIALALSGGRDSMALAHGLKVLGAPFFAVNFEHGIRGDRSIVDSAFVKNWCENNGIECLCISFDTPTYAKEKGLTIEQAARELRYYHLGKLLEEGKCDYVAVAHHKDDQAETILMRILRGTGIRGLKGMSAVSGRYIRPLMDYTREDIDAYVQENNIPFVEDNTNSNDIYTRNYIRGELAELKKRFPALCESLARLSRNANEVDEYLLSQIGEVVVKDGEGILEISEIEIPVLAKRKIQLICEKLGVRQDIEERHYPLIFDLKNAENGKMINLPHGISVHKDGDNLVFSVLSAPDKMWEVPFKKQTIEGVITVTKVENLDWEDGALYVDLNKIPGTAVLRHPKERDIIRKFGGGSKNLGDYLTDKKVPLRKRGELVVCATAPNGYKNSNNILFVLGVEISQDVKIEEGAKIAKITK